MRKTGYRQIYQRVRASIEAGKLRPGDRLPSARVLADELGVARGTVDAAYALLSGEGFVLGQGRGGTVVAAHLPPSPAMGLIAQPAAAVPAQTSGPAPATLLPGVPALDLFPRKVWSQLVSRRARNLSVADLKQADAIGAPALRAAISGYLAVSRGIVCSPDQVFITGGYQSALGLILRLLARPGDDVWIEDPVYRPTRRAVEIFGARPVPAPVDADGMDVEAAIRASPAAALCIVTPAHQFPLGATLSAERRQALLAWAGQSGGWILEDDYEGEFRRDGAALPALKSLDRADRVFYVGSFSKTLFPGLRLGYIVAPAAEAQRLTEIVRWLDGGRSTLEQLVTADFMTEGHFARHLKRMRSAYDGRRAALSAALAERFDGLAQVDRAGGGLHLVMRLDRAANDQLLADRARAAGLPTVPLSPMSWSGDHGQALLVGFGATPERHAPAIAERLRAALA